jgi:hypothetical protein
MGAQGTAIIDFGAFPGSSQASVAVTGQAGILTTSAVEAWIRPQDATATHSVDEHVVEQLKIVAGSIVAATGFTIYAECLNGFAYGTFNVNWVWNG